MKQALLSLDYRLDRYFLTKIRLFFKISYKCFPNKTQGIGSRRQANRSSKENSELTQYILARARSDEICSKSVGHLMKIPGCKAVPLGASFKVLDVLEKGEVDDRLWWWGRRGLRDP